ncbi:polysaccharide pyruvyl transferase [Blastococcus colisei]|uniref:Polysaccharide pyruvyl transferase n=2 Tax=Blastococcus colisei TaxID=1564162 RepID=A0A543P1F8_9ACTN|nr:polysaccharide pyruvyl transferase [Blastococcus colisei]
MLAAHRSLLPEWDILQVPNPPGIERMTAPLLRRVAAICLGGGTLIFNGHFRRTLETLMRAAPDAPRVMLSVGAEDLDYREGRRAGVTTEVQRWRPLLSEFESIRVRGPLSQEALRLAGLQSVVVGDPALALPTALVSAESTTEARARVGVNFGVTDDMWGGNHSAFRAAMVATVRRLVDDGHDVVLLATTLQDHAHLREISTELARQGTTVRGPNKVTLPALDAALQDCDIVVAEKLHALVLAARFAIPTVALEYRPKCRDFQLSIGRGGQVLKTSEVDTEVLSRMVTNELNASHERDRLSGVVKHHQAELRRSAAMMERAMREPS